MPTKALPSAEDLRKLLDYDEHTGKLFWKERPREMFKDGRAASIWNTRFAGKEAFTALMYSGHRHGRIYGKGYLAHRVAWCLLHGDWPSQTIDHINGDPADNRIINLRDVSHAENQRNQKRPRHNTSGHIGVSWCSRSNAWQASICFEKKNKHLGNFKDFEMAVAARQAAEVEYGFHPNHGRTECQVS